MPRAGIGSAGFMLGGVLSLAMHGLLLLAMASPSRSALQKNPSQTVKIKVAAHAALSGESPRKAAVPLRSARQRSSENRTMRAAASSTAADQVSQDVPAPSSVEAPEVVADAARHEQLDPDYSALIHDRLVERRIYPLAAQRLGVQGVVEIAFTVGCDGWVSDLSIEAVDVAPILIDAARKTLAAAQPFPEMPQTRSMKVRIVYEIRGTEQRTKR